MDVTIEMARAVMSRMDQGCRLFLDGRNKYGSHVIPMNTDLVTYYGLRDVADSILSAAEAAGFRQGEYVWGRFHWVPEQTDALGVVKIRGYWEFVEIDMVLSCALAEDTRHD